MPGIWVFPGGKVELDDAGANALEQARQAAARELNEEAGIALPPESLTPFSHWLTPTLVKRRFATWFFITEVAQNLAVDVDGHEIVDYRWWEPAMAIEAHHQGTLPLTPPTLVSLHDLHSLDGAAHGIATFAEREPPQFFPHVVREGNELVFLYHGDSGYEDGDIAAAGPRHRTLGKTGIFTYEPAGTVA